MVVVSNKPRYNGSAFDEYWKISRWCDMSCYDLKQELKQHQYKIPSSANKARLIEVMSRCQRGLMLYDGCQPKELSTFCTNRGIEIRSKLKPKKRQLIATIEDADDQRVFHRFMDLPPELRVQIYTSYFSSLGTVEQPIHPPITRVAHLVRKESLPLFYAVTRFTVGWVRHIPSRHHVAKKKGEFFQNTSAENIGLIRNLSISFFGWCGHELVEWTEGSIKYFRQAAIPGLTFQVFNDPSKLCMTIAGYVTSINGQSGGRLLKMADIDKIISRICKKYKTADPRALSSYYRD